MGTRDAAEAAFTFLRTARAQSELVSLTIPRDVLECFQQDGPGWQDRIIAFLARCYPQSGSAIMVTISARAPAKIITFGKSVLVIARPPHVGR